MAEQIQQEKAPEQKFQIEEQPGMHATPAGVEISILPQAYEDVLYQHYAEQMQFNGA